MTLSEAQEESMAFSHPMQPTLTSELLKTDFFGKIPPQTGDEGPKPMLPVCVGLVMFQESAVMLSTLYTL